MADHARSQVRARTIGFVFQDAMLDLSRPIIDNVMEGSLFSRRSAPNIRLRAAELLDRFGVSEDPSRRPGEISGGQAQRVALCRALIKEPRIILADEPTGNLDHESADTVWNAFRELAEEGVTVVVVTHDQLRATGCQRVLDLGRAG